MPGAGTTRMASIKLSDMISSTSLLTEGMRSSRIIGIKKVLSSLEMVMPSTHEVVVWCSYLQGIVPEKP
jgi:hypothetical protein